MSRKTQMFGPNRGGKKVPDLVKFSTEQRIRRHAEEHFAGRYTRLEIRFRGQFCYIDAYTEPDALDEGWPPADWPESREEYLERLRNTPIHLCRLRYFGGDQWGFAFFSYANNQYKLSVFPSGDFLGTPEVAFHVSAEMYLHDV
jgi:hypothetical protein